MSKEVNKMFSKRNGNLSKDEVANYLSRFLLNIIEKKDEFDLLLADRDSSAFFQVEVKSYPQDGLLDKDGLEKALKKANEHLDKGDKFFQNVVAPAAHLSTSWTKVNLVCFPEIASRQQLKGLGINDNSIKFILTAEDLKSDKWMKNLVFLIAKHQRRSTRGFLPSVLPLNMSPSTAKWLTSKKHTRAL